jgi:hypothetical protein
MIVHVVQMMAKYTLRVVIGQESGIFVKLQAQLQVPLVYIVTFSTEVNYLQPQS